MWFLPNLLQSTVVTWPAGRGGLCTRTLGLGAGTGRWGWALGLGAGLTTAAEPLGANNATHTLLGSEGQSYLTPWLREQLVLSVSSEEKQHVILVVGHRFNNSDTASPRCAVDTDSPSHRLCGRARRPDVWQTLGSVRDSVLPGAGPRSASDSRALREA